MRELDIDISSQRSKPLTEFEGQKFDFVITVCDKALEECPIFSGANYRAAVIAPQSVSPAKIVTVFPDRMERYFSTHLFRPFSGDHNTTMPCGAEQRIPCRS